MKHDNTNPAAEVDESGWQLPAFDLLELAERTSRYCVLIPVINEGERIRAQLARMHAEASGIDTVIADGGSTDGSMDPGFLGSHGVRAVVTKRGSGRVGAQLRAGFAYCLRQGYEGIITVDGNGKDDTRAIPEFARALAEGFGFVQGSRFVEGGRGIRTPTVRLLAIKLLHAPAVSIAARYRFTDTTNGFRAYSRELLLDPRVAPMRAIFSDYELLWYLAARAGRLGYPVKEIPVTRSYPESGATPTKIKSWRGPMAILGELWHLLRGDFAPRHPNLEDDGSPPDA